MKHFITPIVIVCVVTFFSGCARPGFYQAGRSVEQCEYDLRRCISEAEEYSLSQSSGGAVTSAGFRPATLVGLCMRAKGYEYLDANKLPEDIRRIKVRAPFEQYWAIDGSVTAPDSDGAVAVQNAQPGDDQAEPGKLIGYRARLDDKGRHIFAPVYAK